MEVIWEWIIGGFLVFFYAYGRFNNPESDRLSTTVIRYYFAAFSYFLVLGFLFLLLGGGITNSHSIYHELFTHGGYMPTEIAKLPGPLLAALLLTTLLPNFPILNKIDEMLVKVFKDMGNIPRAARRFSVKIRDYQFEVPTQIRSCVVQKLTDFSDNDIRYEQDCSLQYKWTKITSLYIQIKKWKDTKKYDCLFESESMKNAFNKIEKEYETTKKGALSCFEITHRFQNDETVSKTIEHCERNFEEQAVSIIKEIYDFIARGILRCEITQKDRKNRLEEMGFSVKPEGREPLDANQVVTLGVAIFLIFILGALIINLLTGKQSHIGRVIFIAFMVSTTYGLSIVAGIYPKTVWKFADIRQTGHRPMVSYLLSGAIAVCFAFFVSLAFKFVYFLSYLEALRDIKWSYPWFIMSAILAVNVAFITDNYSKKDILEPSWLRWVEGVVSGIIMAGTACVVRTMLLQIENMPDYKIEQIPSSVVLLSISVAIGFLIGVTVPHWYRSVPRQVDELNNESYVI